MKTITCDFCGEAITHQIRYAVTIQRFKYSRLDQKEIQDNVDSFDLCDSCYKYISENILGREVDDESAEDQRNLEGPPEIGF